MKKITLVTFLMFLSVIAFAQKPVKFGVYLGGAAPLGNMGESSTIDKTSLFPLKNYVFANEEATQGFAGAGVGLGFDVTIALPVEGLGVFGGLDFIYNSTNSDLVKYLDDQKKEIEKMPGVSSYEYNIPNFMNIPLLFGVNYQHNFNNIIGIFGEAGVGPNFRLISGEETKTEYSSQPDATTHWKYDSNVTLGFKIGAGVMMWDKMSIVLDFYSLGSAKIKGTLTAKSGDDDVTPANNKFETKNAISASELVLRVGYHF